MRDAAQQTRISVQYLKALEEEDFGKLPGEVFVKGFLKNYGRFLNLDEADLLKRYAELKPQPQPQPQPATPSSGTARVEKTVQQPAERSAKKETPIEPFVWGSIIIVALLVFLFTSLPSRHQKQAEQPPAPALPSSAGLATAPAQTAPDKLYLEVAALEDTWLLVRTDASPQKKAVLKKGESLIWSADDRFLLSYSRVGAVKLLLNGEELEVRGTREAVVRDLVITRAGIANQPAPARALPSTKPKPKQPVQTQQVPPQPQAQPRQEVRSEPAPAAAAPPATPPPAEAAPSNPAPAAPPAPAQ